MVCGSSIAATLLLAAFVVADSLSSLQTPLITSRYVFAKIITPPQHQHRQRSLHLHAKKRSIVNRTRPSRDSSADEDGGSVAPERVEPVYNPNDVRVQFVRSNAQTSSSHDNDSRSSPSSRSSSANELGGEGAVLKSTLLSGKASLFDELESDLAAFKKRGSSSDSVATSSGDSSSSVDAPPSLLERARDVIQAVLIADFFAVIVFLVWFLIGAVLKDSNEIVLMRFQDIFQPVVVPALTVLMAGSMASGVVGSLGNKKKESDGVNY